jgi:hypothetical protein
VLQIVAEFAVEFTVLGSGFRGVQRPFVVNPGEIKAGPMIDAPTGCGIGVG